MVYYNVLLHLKLTVSHTCFFLIGIFYFSSLIVTMYIVIWE